MKAAHIQPGKNITIKAPRGGVVNKEPFLHNDMFLIPAVSAEEGEEVVCYATDCWELKKANPSEIIQQLKYAYWKNGEGVTSKPDGAKKIGHFILDSSDGETIAEVRLGAAI